MKRKSNCILFAVVLRHRHGGQIKIRRMHGFFLPHFMWVHPKYNRIVHLVPRHKITNVRQLVCSFFFHGKITRDDHPTDNM